MGASNGIKWVRYDISSYNSSGITVSGFKLDMTIPNPTTHKTFPLESDSPAWPESE
jgi:hypothetical protein